MCLGVPGKVVSIEPNDSGLPEMLMGSVRFGGNLIYAFVDSDLAVPELDETNNYGSSSPGCGEPRSAEDWRVTMEWAWTSTATEPDSTSVVSGPVVVDVDADAVPDVVFVTHRAGGSTAYNSDGRLRAVSGRDGSEIWSVTDDAVAPNEPVLCRPPRLWHCGICWKWSRE